MIGRRLEHYEVLEKIGEGGMGVVYKARDHHLDRFVALKVVRGDRLADQERRRRFVLEAKAASALNHPGIITIYDIDRAEDVDFIAMEFVKGQTLQALIGRRGMGVGEVLKIGIQIADAVAAAHAAGIVHRDLKPANVMVTEQGLVKVLDFGLAKLTEVETPTEDDRTRTLRNAAPQTEEGQVLGTVAYMAPEQVEAKKIDGRADIFAFGTMLYEMLTGRRAFERESRMATLSAILRDAPQPLGEIAPEIPGEMERVITRCLRKDPERRYQTMKDVKITLEELKEDTESGRLASRTVAAVKPRTNGKLKWIVASVVVVALLGAGAMWWRGREPAAPRPFQMRQLTADGGLTTTPAISPDGKLVAYASDRATGKNLDIWVHPLTAGAQPIRLTRHEADESQPAFSPDGGSIVFFSRRDGGGIYIIPALGGEERLLARAARFPRFSPDGQWVVYSSGMQFGLSESRIFMVPASGGTARAIAPNLLAAWSPIYSTDGKTILIEGAPTPNPGPDEVDWWVAPVEGGAAKPLGIRQALAHPPRVNDFGGARLMDWVGDRIVFVSSNHLWEVDFAQSGRRQLGRARQITSGASNEGFAKGTEAGGKLKLAVGVGSAAYQLWKLKFDPNSGKVKGDLEPLSFGRGAEGPSASGDGTWLTYTRLDPSGNSVRVRNLKEERESTVLNMRARTKMSPDGSQIAYYPPGGRSVLLMPRGGGDAKTVLSVEGSFSIYDWSPNGTRLVYWHGQPIRFATLEIGTGKSSELISHPKYDIHGAALSPDEQFVAFHIPMARRVPVFIAPVRNGKAAGETEWIQVGDDRVQNNHPWWSPDGLTLYWISTLDGASCLWGQRLDKATRRPVGEPFALYHLHGGKGLSSMPLNVFGPAPLPDGMIFALNEVTGNIWIAEEP